ncbi:MAG: hypothetical protein H0W20_05980 [Chthoniobacterales bacterium]|nr:hypothetical protein [Chthoniobacterales bacterium]
MTDRETTIGNGSFGVYIVDSSENTVQLSAAAAGAGREQNIFGANANGPVGVYGSSTANVINIAPPPTKTFVVTSAAGSKDVPGSLTWAIYQVNYQGADLNYINFNIPRGTGEVEITLTETLYIARPTIINGTTQPGYAGNHSFGSTAAN